MPAPEAASATVEDVKDVGGGLLGDSVARCWITMDHLVTKEKYVLCMNTFGRVDWLPLAPRSQDEICQEDISMTRLSGMYLHQTKIDLELEIASV